MTEPQPIQKLVLVVPARNEADLLPRCLHALTAAIADITMSADPAPPRVEVVIVLDHCTDGTDSVAAHWPQFASVRTTHAAVGAARHAGIRHLLPTDDLFTPATWICTTDADSAVPRNWLTVQLAFARNTVDLVLGTVFPDDGLNRMARERWDDDHRLVDGHPYIHGANLGVRADRYLAAGEFERVDKNEDVRLVAELRTLKVTEMRTALIPVLTSGRLIGRTPAGFAGYLRGHVHAPPTSTNAAASAAHSPG